MRTTVTLDSDVEQIVRDRMTTKGVSFKQALNDSVRDGASGRVDYVFQTPVYKMGSAKVDLTKANQIAGELEDEHLIEKMRQGR